MAANRFVGIFPICKLQMIQDQMAEMYVQHEASKLLVYQAAFNKDKGRNDPIEVSVATIQKVIIARSLEDLNL